MHVAWWIGLSAAATVVLIGIDRVTRRLLPFAALLKIALVFPDEAPSRFRTALGSGTTEDLEDVSSAPAQAPRPRRRSRPRSACSASSPRSARTTASPAATPSACAPIRR